MSISFFKVTSPEEKENVLTETARQLFPHNPFIFPSNLDAHTVQWASENNGLWPW